MKVTIRHRWEEVPITEYPVVVGIWIAVAFGVGVFVGQCVGTF